MHDWWNSIMRTCSLGPTQGCVRDLSVAVLIYKVKSRVWSKGGRLSPIQSWTQFMFLTAGLWLRAAWVSVACVCRDDWNNVTPSRRRGTWYLCGYASTRGRGCGHFIPRRQANAGRDLSDHAVFNECGFPLTGRGTRYLSQYLMLICQLWFKAFQVGTVQMTLLYDTNFFRTSHPKLWLCSFWRESNAGQFSWHH